METISDAPEIHCLDTFYIRQLMQDNGIHFLTGESEATSMLRGLYDLTRDGLNLIREFFSMRILDGNNWNPGSKEDPHVASIMLTDEIIVQIAMYITLKNGHPIVSSERKIMGENRKCLYWFNTNEDMTEALDKGDEFTRSYIGNNIRRYYATEKTRNQHMMSGRVT